MHTGSRLVPPFAPPFACSLGLLRLVSAPSIPSPSQIQAQTLDFASSSALWDSPPCSPPCSCRDMSSSVSKQTHQGWIGSRMTQRPSKRIRSVCGASLAHARLWHWPLLSVLPRWSARHQLVPVHLPGAGVPPAGRPDQAIQLSLSARVGRVHALRTHLRIHTQPQSAGEREREAPTGEKGYAALRFLIHTVSVLCVCVFSLGRCPFVQLRTMRSRWWSSTRI